MKYRAEIDGLRALAVVPVILFHAGFEPFSGGFVGVDVFFVISGYLITTILVDDLENNRFSIAKFYERRARRILPALFFVMLSCIPFAWMWMFPRQMFEFSQSVTAVSLFSSNVLFWRQGNYFAGNAEERPLLHTWSLAVEEQYYVLFPIFLALTWRFGKNRVFFLITVSAVASFILSEWGRQNEPTANFYLAPTRAWELLAGSVTAFVVRARGIAPNNILASIGLIFTIASVFIYDRSTPFPSVYTLLPVGGVVLIILFAGTDTYVKKILSIPLFVGIGLISYSAYLWHQPLFAFARIRSPLEDPSQGLMLSLSVLSIFLAVFSWKFVEKPFRNPNPLLKGRARILTVSAIGLSAFAVSGAYIQSLDIDSILLNDEERKIYSLTYLDIGIYKTDGCFIIPDDGEKSFSDKCVVVKKGVVMGDSHAAAISIGMRRRFGFSQLSVAGCPPVLGYSNELRLYCGPINKWRIKKVLAEHPDVLILHANWRLYSEFGFPEFQDVNVFNELEKTIEHLKKGGIENIVLLGGSPQYYSRLPEVLVELGAKISSDTMVDANVKSIYEVDTRLKEIAERQHVHYVSLLDHLCSGTKCKVFIGDGSKYTPLMWDGEHLTEEGSAYVANLLSPVLE